LIFWLLFYQEKSSPPEANSKPGATPLAIAAKSSSSHPEIRLLE